MILKRNVVTTTAMTTAAPGSGFTKLTLKHCNQDKYGTFSTLSAAQSACSADSNCKGVYDPGCNDQGSFFLCPMSATYSASSASCVYEKTQGAATTTPTTIPTTTTVSS